jgi:hypothetical protein
MTSKGRGGHEVGRVKVEERKGKKRGEERRGGERRRRRRSGGRTGAGVKKRRKKREVPCALFSKRATPAGYCGTWLSDSVFLLSLSLSLSVAQEMDRL